MTQRIIAAMQILQCKKMLRRIYFGRQKKSATVNHRGYDHV
jgi:hypothetical protein